MYYVCFFWIAMSTIHITAFLLPVAAYNGQIARLQVSSPLLWISFCSNLIHPLPPAGAVLLQRAAARPCSAARRCVWVDAAARQRVPEEDERQGRGGGEEVGAGCLMMNLIAWCWCNIGHWLPCSTNAAMSLIVLPVR